MVVVSRTSDDSLYYRGVRLGDQAGIELGGVTPSADGYTAVNPSDGTRYEVTLRRLIIIVVNGQVAASEPAVESAFL